MGNRGTESNNKCWAKINAKRDAKTAKKARTGDSQEVWKASEEIVEIWKASEETVEDWKAAEEIVEDWKKPEEIVEDWKASEEIVDDWKESEEIVEDWKASEETVEDRKSLLERSKRLSATDLEWGELMAEEHEHWECFP